MAENRKFPIPADVREAFKKFAEQATGRHVNDTNIKKINVRTFSNRIKKQIVSEIRVGEELDLNLSNIPHEPVFAIFESDDKHDYLVVTPDKGKSNRTVYFFQEDEVMGVEREELG